MKKVYILLVLATHLFYLSEVNAQQSSDNDSYIFKKGDPSGIGKWYMSREIAHIMGFQGMSWLERPEREKEENTSVLLRNMKIRPDDVIADIGAGSGYHVLKMAPIAHDGMIYAVDIQQEMLDALKSKTAKQGLENITLVKGNEKTSELPKNTVDKVIMVDVYHEFAYPVEMINSIKQALKPNGEIFLIEYRTEDDNVPIKRLHKMSEAQAVKEMNAAGMKLKQNISNLPWQHCMIFVKK